MATPSKRESPEALTRLMQSVEQKLARLAPPLRGIELGAATPPLGPPLRSLATRLNAVSGPPTLGLSKGGSVPGEPRGTDTVPAWLTPGEVVIPRDKAVANKGTIDQLLGSSGPVPSFSKGGTVKGRPRYLSGGGWTSWHRMKDLHRAARPHFMERGPPAVSSGWTHKQWRLWWADRQRTRRQAQAAASDLVDFSAADLGHRVAEAGSAPATYPGTMPGIASGIGSATSAAATTAGTLLGGAIGGPPGAALGYALGKLTGAVLESAGSLGKWNREMLEGVFRFAEFSGEMAAVSLQQRVHDIERMVRQGRALAPAAEGLEQSNERLQKALDPWRLAFTKTQLEFQSGLSKMTSSLLEGLNKLVGEKKQPDGNGPGGARDMRAGEWAYVVGVYEEEAFARKHGLPIRFDSAHVGRRKGD